MASATMKDEKTLRHPFRVLKKGFLDLSEYSFKPADKRYILHICRQRFRHLNKQEERRETITLLRRYNIKLKNIIYWLRSAVAQNIDAVGDVPALPCIYLPGHDGKFNCNIEEHPNFDMDIIVHYYVDYKDVLFLSYETIQEWYGINRTRFGKCVDKVHKNVPQLSCRKLRAKKGDGSILCLSIITALASLRCLTLLI